MRGLYAIADLDALERRGLELVPFAEAVLGGRPAALQLRAKHATPEQTLARLRELKPLCAAAGVPLVANDRVDFAVVAKTDMVHLGQEDAKPSFVRAIAPSLAIGISTHTPEELNRALGERPSYVAYGPIYPTRSKAQPDPVVGVSGLRQAAHLIRHFARNHAVAPPPLVAIGGVTLERVSELVRYAACVAVIADLLPAQDLVGDDAYEFVRVRVEQYGAAFTDPAVFDSSVEAPGEVRS